MCVCVCVFACDAVCTVQTLRPKCSTTVCAGALINLKATILEFRQSRIGARVQPNWKRQIEGLQFNTFGGHVTSSRTSGHVRRRYVQPGRDRHGFHYS
jgi:hypothetical protein